ncbi:MAG: hypothetical protein L0I76_26270 [Pseudonocardia sp.]|nr:hypothetical protein [Pseudonocardia sp.]
MTARGWRGVVEAFRVELGPRSRSRAARPARRRRPGGTAPRCPRCELFVKRMCPEPYAPCGVCVGCCDVPDVHKPPKREDPR